MIMYDLQDKSFLEINYLELLWYEFHVMNSSGSFFYCQNSKFRRNQKYSLPASELIRLRCIDVFVWVNNSLLRLYEADILNRVQ